MKDKEQKALDMAEEFNRKHPLFAKDKTLRDEFAMAAMQGLIGVINLREDGLFKTLSEKAYEVADEMMKARLET